MPSPALNDEQKNQIMKKQIFILLCAGSGILFQSCNNETGTTTAQTEKIQLAENDSIFNVNESGFKFSIVLPKDLMINESPQIKMNTATGELHITLGEKFWIVASQEKGDVNKFKADMEDDMLFKHEIVEENTQSLMYKRVLPDGTEYDYSYKSCNDVSGIPYIFRTSEEGEFTKENVTRMKTAIGTVHANV